MGCVSCQSHKKKSKDLDIQNIPIMLNNQKTPNLENINDNWLELGKNSILTRRYQKQKLSAYVQTKTKSPSQNFTHH